MFACQVGVITFSPSALGGEHFFIKSAINSRGLYCLLPNDKFTKIIYRSKAMKTLFTRILSHCLRFDKINKSMFNKKQDKF